MPPASTAAMQPQRALEAGVSFTANLARPTLHHTIGSLMQVGILSVSYFRILHKYWDTIYELYSRTAILGLGLGLGLYTLVRL